MTSDAPARNTREQLVFDDVTAHPQTTVVHIADRLQMGANDVASALRKSADVYVRQRLHPERGISRENPYTYTVKQSAARPVDRRRNQQVKP